MTKETEQIIDAHVSGYNTIASPRELKERLATHTIGRVTVAAARREIASIITGESTKRLIVLGPCSIHNIPEAMEYAERLKVLQTHVSDKLLLVMRTYFEKPRTHVGWKGFINDPRLDGTFDVEHGIEQARKLLAQLDDLGVPTATEALDPITFQYLSDLIAWASIGARTTESQTHREMASGLSMPVGFKNTTQGSVDAPINAIRSARSPHTFLGIDQEGRVAIVNTQGNPHCHIILRGGDTPNYDEKSVAQAQQKLAAAGLPANVVVDCSHGNSRKDHRNQHSVLRDVLQQMVAGNEGIIGVMLESHLDEGNQPISAEMKKGVSITDACIGWEETERLVLEMYVALTHS